MATIEVERQGATPSGPGTPRRVRVLIRRVHPWSVLKFSLIFYVCLMLVLLVGTGILYVILWAAGVLDTVAELLTDVGFGERGAFEFNAGYIFRTLGLIGLISAAMWAGFTVFVAFLYNLIADVTGGVEITMVERRER